MKHANLIWIQRAHDRMHDPAVVEKDEIILTPLGATVPINQLVASTTS